MLERTSILVKRDSNSNSLIKSKLSVAPLLVATRIATTPLLGATRRINGGNDETRIHQ
jgi:hypothetical protein